MKIKMPCKLCELSIDQQQKLGFNNCNHTSFLSQISPISSLPINNIQNSQIFMPPLREMMLAAYLFRGEFFFFLFVQVIMQITCKKKENEKFLLL